MIKLLKYDLKRNMNTVLGTIAVFIIVSLLLYITAQVKGWDQVITFVLSIFLYSIASIIMLILTCRTYVTNIKAYHRRLLPFHSVWTVLSSLLFGLITAASVSILMVLNGMLYRDEVTLLLRELMLDSMNYKDIIIVILAGVWLNTFGTVTIFMASTIGSSFRNRKNVGVWLGILSFFVIQYAVSWVETKLFGNSVSSKPVTIGIDGTTSINSDGGSVEIAPVIFSIPWDILLFEICVVGLMMWGMTYLINKRVEV